MKWVAVTVAALVLAPAAVAAPPGRVVDNFWEAGIQAGLVTADWEYSEVIVDAHTCRPWRDSRYRFRCVVVLDGRDLRCRWGVTATPRTWRFRTPGPICR